MKWLKSVFNKSVTTNPPHQDFRRFLTAIKSGNEKKVRDYIQKYPGRLGWVELHVAVDNKQHEMMQILLQAGAQVDAKDGGATGDTPLYRAILRRDLRAMAILLNHAANPQEPCGVSPTTPYELACALKAVEQENKYVDLLDQYPVWRHTAAVEDVLVNGVVPDQNIKIRIRLKKNG